MRVSKKDVICGLPAPTARQLMRAYYGDHSTAVACEVLGLDHQAARNQLCAFESAGYLRKVDRGIAADDEFWMTTVLGNALAQANFGKPINRVTAERHLAGVIERARAYNADPDRLLTVAEITVFGSFLDPDADHLGDLDIAVITVRRETNGDRFIDQVLAYARASGRNFSTFLEELHWPTRELRIILKNRSPAISITNEDVRELTNRFEVAYAVSEDPGAIPPPPDAMVER